MEFCEIFRHVDHTILAAVSKWSDVKRICEEAIEFNTASVCIPPAYVARVKKEYDQKLKICTVIGFPLGYNTTETKVFETKDAIVKGADEIDMVVNLGYVKDGAFDKVTEEIKALKQACGDKTLKVIIETSAITDEEKIALCQCVTEAGAEYIKTSTGFDTGGATLSDVALMKAHIGKDVKIKASGGMRTYEDFVAFLNAGADRLGTSSAIKAYHAHK